MSDSILEETRLSAGQAARWLGVHPSTIGRWHTQGMRGVRLEAVRFGRKLVTSREACIRFTERLAALDQRPLPPAVTTPHRTSPRVLAAEREAQAEGL